MALIKSCLASGGSDITYGSEGTFSCTTNDKAIINGHEYNLPNVDSTCTQDGLKITNKGSNVYKIEPAVSGDFLGYKNGSTTTYTSTGFQRDVGTSPLTSVPFIIASVDFRQL